MKFPFQPAAWRSLARWCGMVGRVLVGKSLTAPCLLINGSVKLVLQPAIQFVLLGDFFFFFFFFYFSSRQIRYRTKYLLRYLYHLWMGRFPFQLDYQQRPRPFPIVFSFPNMEGSEAGVPRGLTTVVIHYDSVIACSWYELEKKD